jgi:transcriptional regulator with XRE-family HTH domain
LKGSEYLIYDNIKKVCKEKGLSVSSVEKQAGLSTGAISKWNTSSPTIEKLQAVATVLKVNVNKLIG